MISRRALFGLLGVALTMPRVRSFKLHAVAAAHMPHQLTIHSSDPAMLAHYLKGGIFEVREFPGFREVRMFDSLEQRWLSSTRGAAPRGPAPVSIALYRPA